MSHSQPNLQPPLPTPHRASTLRAVSPSIFTDENIIQTLQTHYYSTQTQFLQCLQDLNLTDSQKADIKTIVQDSRSTLKAAKEVMKTDHDKLIADANAGADKATIGQDFLTVKADREKIQNAISAIQAQVASKLTSDQQSKFQACVDAAKNSAAMGRRGDSF